jgi:hypothetical protein
MIQETLIGITACPNVKMVLHHPSIQHPCATIVNTQAHLPYFQLPEPWCGDIANAPILVISSNPAISETELYPDSTWSQKMINDFFVNRFKNRGKKYSWVYDYKVLLKSGRRGRKVSYWSCVTKRVEEIIQQKPIPGKDFCITELVHCKSRGEIGVSKAFPECARLHLNRVMAQSNACIIIAFGSIVKDFLNGVEQYQNKPILYLPHPNARGFKTIPKLIEANKLTTDQILQFRARFNGCKNDHCATSIELPEESEVIDFIDERLALYESDNLK